MRLEEQLLENDAVQAVQARYEANGIPFGGALDDAIKQATGNIKSPVVQGIVRQVVNILLENLEAELNRLSKEEGRNGFGKFWRKWWSKIFG